MYYINKITSSPVVDFAAEELKKYLRMMMPKCGEIAIKYAPEAKDGFRLGLMSDFGLDTSEAENTELDDILHIDTDENGGVIAGSNPRSVLLAVYRYLTINGCRWLFPGIDGEFIPVKNIEATKYHKMADCRFRGQCNEGAEAQHLMMEAIDFTPKIGMNIFMIEFENPRYYYDSYYEHRYNQYARDPEPVSAETILQWKRLCEVEIAKRGLQFHDMGHGWTAEPLGISSDAGWTKSGVELPEETKQYLAMVNGKRELWGGVPLNTEVCMSNPEVRAKMVKYIADYAELATNVDFLHIWLSDGSHNHCECDECRKMIPSDWYMMLMNEIDDELTARNLNTRIVFICYTDTTWAPEKVQLKNPDRFSLLLAAITRSYTDPVDPDLDVSKVELPKFDLNKSQFPGTVNEYVAHADRWMKHCGVKTFVYEYHYWWPQYRDLGLMDSVKLLYDDIRGYKAHECDGLVEDGSQRSFFPNGFSYYVYGNTLFDNNADFEEMKKDYFAHAYGSAWEKVLEMFESISKTVDYRYFHGKLSSDRSKGIFYNPELVPSLKKIISIIDENEAMIKEHKNMPYRAQTVSYRMLIRYLDYCRSIVKAFILEASGLVDEARNEYISFIKEFGKYEMEMELCYDHFNAHCSWGRIFGHAF